jgi:hypothetical protein
MARSVEKHWARYNLKKSGKMIARGLGLHCIYDLWVWAIFLRPVENLWVASGSLTVLSVW